MSEGVLNAQPEVIIIDNDSTGSTVIDVVQSLSAPPDTLAASLYTEQNNIQSTSVSLESFAVHSHGTHHRHTHVQMMSRKLVSRLKAYS